MEGKIFVIIWGQPYKIIEFGATSVLCTESWHDSLTTGKFFPAIPQAKIGKYDIKFIKAKIKH